ncbi:MAG: TlpA disulfide reductase family protein [Bacteroidales bacterium]|jgi:peroxiredoxin|nr:TlpA disulfide reductase family protein [Bacteroidales bacterium]
MNFKIRHIILLIGAVFTFQSLSATRIHGTVSDYANFELIFYRYSDLITEKTDTLFTLRIDSDGSFDKTFEMADTAPVYTLVGIYKIWFVAEPNGDYDLVFPDYVEKTNAEIYNPFFKPILLMAGMKGQGKTDLNYLINQFDSFYNDYLDSHLLDFLARGRDSGVEFYIDSLKQDFSYHENNYFNAWKKFRFANLRRIAYERNHRFTINQYFRQDEVHYQNPAYMFLFKELFENYFDRFLLRPDGEELLKAVNLAKSPHAISKVLSRMFELDNQALQEYVMIKGLRDAYFGDNFRKQPILITLDSIADFSNFPEHRIAAKNVIESLTHLAKGTLAPDFSFSTIDGKQGMLSELKNRYLYVAFYQTELTTCQQEIGPLIEQAIKHNGDFEVLMVLFDEDKYKAMNQLKHLDIPFEIVFPDNPEQIKKQWNLKTFPTYFLLDTQGKFIFSPAPSPTEQFENYFFRYVKD